MIDRSVSLSETVKISDSFKLYVSLISLETEATIGLTTKKTCNQFLSLADEIILGIFIFI